ncbi:MAG: ABC transporter permease subunit [Ardenticatenaceae bacterium]|nr:ABC transporter permease subunit [Ardenticatenaceae bacterium]MCB9443186.1 ABC transporter permease subunit [Ardenticatenaceae bacterium]
MNIKNIFAYLLNPRTRIQKTPANGGSIAALDDGSEWSRPQFLSTGSFILNLPLVIGLIILLGLTLIILFGPLWASYDPNITTQSAVPYYDPELREMIKPPFPPSWQHPFGTDTWGNDILSLILFGARVTLIAGAYITAVRVIVGAFIGSLAGWFAHSRFDRIAMSLISAVASVPALLSAMILIFALDIQNGLWVFIVALSVFGWTEVAQYIRSEMIVIREMPYIEGAHSVGLNNLQIIVRHALPNVLSQILIMTFLEMGTVLILLAELGFLGVYIGGGTNYTADIFDTGGPKLLNEVPEWGALVSIGAPYLRSYPYMILAPALAFFMAVAGLNALGEGLRQAVERSAVSTNFLLRKEMVLVAAAFVAATALVLKYTGPSLSYSQVAEAFDGQAAYDYATGLNQGAEPSSGETAAAYIEEQFKEIGLQPGWKVGINSNYIYRTVETVVRPFTPPQLALLNEDGTVQQSFQHQVDFGYVIEEHGGSGQASAPLTLLAFQPGHISLAADGYDPAQFEGLDVRGRIVMLAAGNAPEYVTTELLRRGAQGILWVTAVPEAIRSQIQLTDPAQSYLRNPTLPIFKVSTAVANTLLSSENNTINQLIIDSAAADQSGAGWFAHDLSTQVSMSVQLDAPQEVEIPHVMGFLPGYDNDLADQLVIVLAAFDGLGGEVGDTAVSTANDSHASLGIMMEMARLWEAQNLDPRRSVLFIAWGGEQLDESGAAAFLEDNDHFRKLSARVNTPPLKPVLLFQLGPLGGAGDAVVLEPDSAANLQRLWQDAAKVTDLPTMVGNASNPGLITTAIPTLAVYDAGAEHPNSGKLAKVGQTLTLSLIEILRQVKY